jgi:hypothetical protein
MEQSNTIKDDQRRCSLLFLKKHQYKLMSISLLTLMIIIVLIICTIVFTKSPTIDTTAFTTQKYSKLDCHINFF